MLTRLPRRVKRHFHGLKEAFPGLRGVALFDRLDQHPMDGGIEFLMWTKREIENYLCSRAALEGFARTSDPEGSPGPIFRPAREKAMARSSTSSAGSHPATEEIAMTRRIPHPALARRLLATMVLALASATPLAAQCDDCVFPGETWEAVPRSQLADHGWDAGTLARASAFLRDSANSTGVVVAHKGRVVFSFGDVEELSYLASVRKSILAMLYGHWVENGVIDLDATLEELGVDDVGGLLPIERRATVDHLVTARSGVYHPASNSGDNLADAPPRGSQQPGAYMLYSNWDFNAAGAVFEQLTGRDIYDEAQAQLAIPLDFEDWDRSAQRKSGNLTVSRNPAYHFWLSARDMARIGHLMLNEGAWRGEQVISREWARRIVSVVTPLEEMNPPGRRDGYFGYGYMWWIFDGPRVSGPFEGAYTGRGAVGQWISVFPALDLVIAHKTKSAYGRTTRWRSWQRLVELLFEAHGVEMPGPYPWAGEGS